LRFLWYVDLRVDQDHPRRNGESNYSRFSELFFAEKWWPEEWEPSQTLAKLHKIDWAKTTAKSYISQQGNAGIGRVYRLITELQRYLAEPYKFDVFLPNSYNFGIITTYRQFWEPQGFQAGELVSTIPLSPGEIRKVSVKHNIKTEDKSLNKVLSSFSDTRDRKDTSKITGEINRKVDSKMVGKFGTKVDYNNFEASGDFSTDQGSESSRKKTELREAVKHSVQEYKDERTVELTTATTEDMEHGSEIEIRNPNNELTVTYLFYELQQRFHVKERLHNVESVVMVAFDVPAPHEINEAWLLRHAWILRDVMLDERLLVTLEMLSESFTGSEISLEVLKRQWLAQIDILESYKRDFEVHYQNRELGRIRIDGFLQQASAENLGNGA